MGVLIFFVYFFFEFLCLRTSTLIWEGVMLCPLLLFLLSLVSTSDMTIVVEPLFNWMLMMISEY